MFEFLALGSIAFWVVFAILSCIIIGTVCHDDGPALGFSVFLVSVFTAIYYKTILTFSPVAILVVVLSYFAIGGVWSVIHWYRFTGKIVNKVKNGEISNPGEIRVSRHRTEITSWVVFWPWSIIWELTGGILENIWDALVGTYKRVANKRNQELLALSFKNK